MATKTELNQQLQSTNNALALLKKQLADAKPGSAEQTQLSISIYDLEQQKKSTQQQLATFLTPASNPTPAVTDAAAAEAANTTSQPEKEIPVTTQTFDDGSKLETYADGATVSTNTAGEIVFNSAPTTPEKQAEIPVTTQTFDDGSKLETYADGSTVSTDSTGAITFNSATVNPIQQESITSPAEKLQADIAAHGQPYDEGEPPNLMPGWSLSEDNDPVWVGGDFVEPVTAASAKASRDAVTTNKTGATVTAKGSNTINKQVATEPDDWRVRLSLAPSAEYLYNVAKPGDILFPLTTTNGVLFPYTPQIQTAYKANYESADLTHSNYKMHFYKNSSVEEVSITADFTAQDTAEANYLLAVIHFFKSATKMFYGQDKSPAAGTPPPLLYLSGFGAYQFDRHPLLLTSFTYSLPNDVDYIRAGSSVVWGGTNIAQLGTKPVNSAAATPLDKIRLLASSLTKGGAKPAPNFSNANLSGANSTYVPTKIQIQMSFIPVVTRKDISDNFSLKEYATGALSRGSRSGGGIW